MVSGRAQGWRAGGDVVVRTPLLPLTTLAAWANAPDPRRYLASVLALPEVDEAIFVASPGLHAAIATWRAHPLAPASRPIELSLAKYVARMAGRSTPFGLFSGVSSGTLGATTTIELAPRAEYRRRTRLDNDYLFVLTDELARSPENRERLVFYPNTSIYRIAGKLRYAVARLDGKERHYHLVSVDPTPYLEATLARAAARVRLADLAAALVDPEITLDEARAFVDELVDSQLLVPALGIHVTGPEPIEGVLGQLQAGGIEDAHRVLDTARSAIAAIDAGGVGNPPELYRAVATVLEPLPTKVDLARLFQVDMVKPAAISIGQRVVADVARAIGQLATISRTSEAASLEQFRSAFRDRWDDREIPLAEALDEESGIGFEAERGPGSEGSPLLAGIGFPRPGEERRPPARPLDAFLLRRLGAALASADPEIVLTDADIDALKLDRPARLPDALSAMVRIAATPDQLARGEITTLLEGTSGPSGARLLGRFCQASREIEAMVRAHHDAEQALAPDAVFAEIVHLNEGRIGNILCRPVLRDHEIVYLGVSGAPLDRQLGVEDLVISVVGDRIVLRSRRLGREILPRLTTAHNYRLRSVGTYRFLCALASQHVEHGGFSWGPLSEAPFLPRVRLGRVVLARATWNLGEPELAPITTAVRAAKDASTEGVRATVAALRDARRLPRFLVVSAGDNELPIDLDNPQLVAVFADELSGQKRVTVREMFPAPDQLVVHGPEGGFSNELVLTFTRSGAAADPRPALPPTPTTRRRFAPGSEWMYAKLYCGESTADRVLRDAIAPVVRQLLADGDADRWFFIRYADPEPHLRLRLHGDPARLAARGLPALERVIAPLIERDVVRKLALDTYDREIERYGGDRGIELIEELFWRDSEAVLQIVELLDGDAGADARWRLALRGIDSLLETLGLAEEARERVVASARESIGREFRADTPLWARVGDRFAKERASLDLLFARDPQRDLGHDLEPGFEILAQRDAAIRPTAVELARRDAAGELTPTLSGLAWSIVHMHANRLLHASHRAQEMVLYDFLRRLYASRRARAKAAT